MKLNRIEIAESNHKILSRLIHYLLQHRDMLNIHTQTKSHIYILIYRTDTYDVHWHRLGTANTRSNSAIDYRHHIALFCNISPTII